MCFGLWRFFFFFFVVVVAVVVVVVVVLGVFCEDCSNETGQP